MKDHGWVAVDLTPALMHEQGGEIAQMPGDLAWKRLHEQVVEVKDLMRDDPRVAAKIVAGAPKLLGVIFVAHSACLARERMTYLGVLKILTPPTGARETNTSAQ